MSQQTLYIDDRISGAKVTNAKRKTYTLQERIKIGELVHGGALSKDRAVALFGVSAKTIGVYEKLYLNSEEEAPSAADVAEIISIFEQARKPVAAVPAPEQEAPAAEPVAETEAEPEPGQELLAAQAEEEVPAAAEEPARAAAEPEAPESGAEPAPVPAAVQEQAEEGPAVEQAQPEEVPARQETDEGEKAPAVPARKKRRGLLYAAAALLVLAIAAAAWLMTRPKFHDLTVELGTESISIAEFMTPYANGRKVSFVTDPATIDITKIGTTEVTLRNGRREETVELSVVDTIAPAVVFRQEVETSLSVVPVPEQFVESIEDESSVIITFEEPLTRATSYGDREVVILVTDEGGNVTKGTSKVTYLWLRSELTVEYGTQITKGDLLLDPELGDDLISQADVDALNKADLGEYTVESTLDGKTQKCRVIIQDTTPPVLKLRDVRIILTQTATMSSFVSSVSDNYGNVKLSMPTQLDFKTLGVQNVTIEARDPSGNVTVGHCKLTIKEDDVAPVFSGLKDMNVSKHSSPDYVKGVTAKDNIDGVVDFTVDASGVDVHTAGTYYVKYTAVDRKGNKATAKRKVTVAHDDEDTDELCRKVFSQISDKSPVGISTYIRKYISYSSSWGDSDPVWYGLTTRRGNCFVHAKVLQKMLSLAGYDNKLIWTTDRSHYWNLVRVGGHWWHIDSTPSSTYPTYLMNDEQRKAHLKSGKDWDRDAWPACDG